MRNARAFALTLVALGPLTMSYACKPSLDALEAMLHAGPLRLRPILMTTIATMMAAVPPLLGIGPGTETRSPMAAAVLGGLVVSTVLSLVVVPAFYVVADRAKRRLGGLLFRKRQAVA